VAKRKILVFSGYRSEYLKIRSVLLSLKSNNNVDLKIVSLGAHNLNRFANTYKDILEDGLEISYFLYTNVEGDIPGVMAQSVAMGISQIVPILNIEKPDIVLLCADRYEILSVAIAASLSNMIIAHVQGGEVSGTIDESIRHVITKFSHIHFPATELSRQRIIRMGENENNVFNCGCAFVDYIKEKELNKNKEDFIKNNFPLLDSKKPYGIIIQHSVTTEYKKAYEQMMITLKALHKFGMQCILIWPNSDTGSEEISKAIRVYREKNQNNIVVDAWRSIKTDLYLNLLYHSDFLIGNSSSGIREAHIYGIPAINIGTRQNGRERTKNIIDVQHNEKEILNSLKENAGKRIFDTNLYGDGTAGKNIANILENIKLDNLLNKRFI
jgi:UDP-hydrolysing UDP-N-acetyl-D-glucosamine 2-epimerase